MAPTPESMTAVVLTLLLSGFIAWLLYIRHKLANETIALRQQVAQKEDALVALRLQLTATQKELTDHLNVACSELQQRGSIISNASSELQNDKGLFLELQENPTQSQLVRFYSIGKTRAELLLDKLEEGRVSLALPLVIASEAASDAKHVPRKDRFEDYKERLISADHELCGYIEDVVRIHSYQAKLLIGFDHDAIASGCGHAERVIQSVKDDLQKEANEDAAYLKQERDRKKAFIEIVKMQEEDTNWRSGSTYESVSRHKSHSAGSSFLH
jgi:hypothetical protein